VAANQLFIINSEQIAYQSAYLQDQKSLRLKLYSFSERGSNCTDCSFADKGCQYVDYA